VIYNFRSSRQTHDKYFFTKHSLCGMRVMPIRIYSGRGGFVLKAMP